MAAVTENAALNKALLIQGILRLDPLFPRAVRPNPGASVVTPRGDRIAKPDLTRWHRAVLPKDADIYQVAESLKAVPGVAYAEPDYLRKPVGNVSENASALNESEAQSLPGPFSDPLYDRQWHLNATNTPQAWQWLEDNGFPPGGNRDIIVAVIDTGVDYTHPDLAANMWVNGAEFNGSPGVDDDGNGYVDDIHGADMVYPDGDPMDDHGHGTHVAGIIAARAGNGIGGVGVAYNVQIMAVKAAQYSGVLATSDIAEAIYYAVEKGADVINMSFGGYARSQLEEDALAVAFGQAVLVAAAGNDGKVNLPCPFGRDMYPAAYNWVLGVMASDSAGGLAGFSNYDCAPHDSHEYELPAPGVDIWSTLPGEQYAAWDGTSMSAPIVSGIAALLRTRWWDKDVYSSRFIMGQIASNGGPVADAHAAITMAPQPELSYLEHWLFDTQEQSASDDDDGIVDAGETIDLAIVIRNHWGKADPVVVTLEPWAEGAFQPDPYVTMIVDEVDYGAVGSFNWDDNGLIYDAEGVITGVRHPFSFSVSADCPNDHVIPFRLTMTAENGYDPDDPNTPYTFVSRFYLIVQRGRELPRIISEDMVLSKDYFWIVPDQTLIESGFTVNVTEGTQIQWGAPDPDDPYSSSLTPRLQVEGSLLVIGSPNLPVELFFSDILAGYVSIYNMGVTQISYARIRNPELSYAGGYYKMDTVDHCYFNESGVIGTYSLTNSIVRFQQNDLYGRFQPGMMSQSLINPKCTSGWGEGPCVTLMFDIVSITDSVFLQDNQNNRTVRWDLGVSLPYYFSTEAAAADDKNIKNAFLSKYWDPEPYHWMELTESKNWCCSGEERLWYYGIANNYWGTTSETLIDNSITDFNDDFNKAHIVYQPILANPAESTYPFVVDVVFSTATEADAKIVGQEEVTFTVTYNRDMNTTVQPAVSFGPDTPETDYTVHPVGGGWQDARTWKGTFNVNPITGDGYQLMRIAGGRAADDPWLVAGEDVARFRFEVITSGTESMNLQATGGEGYLDLMWTQNDFDLLAGFNLYRSTTSSGTYSRINTSIIPPEERAFRDTDVQPGQPYYYKFTVVKSDMTESDFSNVATATPTDTIPPVIGHIPVTSAAPGIAVSIYADVTDNVNVQGVTLYYRTIGGATFQSKAMANTTGNRYSATLEGSLMVSPGMEYYIQATDGVSAARSGEPSYPWQITVVDKPVVTSVSPDHGPSSGGTLVTISGTNFKAGAGVTFGGAAAGDVSVISSSQISCTTPPHFPETVDVAVSNPDDQPGTLLRAFTYQSDTVNLGLPNTGGGQNAIVQVPVNLANVEGLVAADITITFDNSILHARGATTGNLVPGWTLESNTGTPGQIMISAASPGGSVTGSGVLANIEFEVVGAPGSSSTLQFSQLSLNDGAIPFETIAGQFSVDLVYGISGIVSYWNNGAPVRDVLLKADGNRIYTAQSSMDGTFTVSNLPVDDYILTASKSDGADGISAYDASLVLQHAVQLSTLTGHAAVAGDVNKSGAINAMDATYILQKAVGLISLPFPGAGVVWEFDPANRSYTGLNNDQSNQNFTGILIGDVNGNWTADLQTARIAGTRNALFTATNENLCFSLPDLGGAPESRVVMALQAMNAETILSADLVITYPQDKVTAVSVEKTPFSDSMSLATNLTIPGEIRIAMAGATGVSGNGDLLKITFQLTGADGETANVSLTQIAINDVVVGCIQNGSILITDSLCGDVNENDRVDIGDAMFIAQYLVGNRDASSLNLNLGNVNVNDRVDIGDPMFIAQYLVGNRDCLCLGTGMEVCTD